MISEDYLRLNQNLHETHGSFGSGGWRWVGVVIRYCREHKCETVLDYGCGKGAFADWFPTDVGISVAGYDPATAPDDPDPADFVLCIDVMEHIEPGFLDEVLVHIRSKMKRCGIFLISTRKAKKMLADGRNAHLIVENEVWWGRQLQKHFGKVRNLLPEHPELLHTDEALFYVEA
jgi:2-polyprenyl-3-methyl-5-hydroxy-6-metoxy-1,4-benzoquinol methylase